MKASFFGYYPPSTEEYERLWNEGIIVLDTNVLLNFYRLPTSARDEMISVLELLKDRLWIPHQVALEFQRRRLNVISTERKSIENALNLISDSVDQIKEKVTHLQLDKRGLDIDSKALINDLDKANNQIVEAIKATQTSQLDISVSDPIRQKLDELFENCVGDAPKTQADLDELVSGGEERFKEKIPPGFMDTEKDKNPNEATFIFDNIKYQRKFGDLILWNQLINHATNKDIKLILLITADRKEDWWWREQGKTVGPHPELIREIKRKGNVELFWMYSSVQFVENANKYASAKVSNESVAEIKQITSTMSTDTPIIYNLVKDHIYWQEDEDLNRREFFNKNDARFAEEVVGRWLSQREENVETNRRGFPDFLAYRDNKKPHGYEVKNLRRIDHIYSSSAVINSLLRGYLETKEGRLSGFTLIMVTSKIEPRELTYEDNFMAIRDQLERLLIKYPIDSIIIGSIIGDRFEVFTLQDANDILSRDSY